MLKLFGIDNWKVLNDYEVSVMSEMDMFREGTVRIPDQLMEYFGCDRREKRVMFLFEGREYPSYLESESFDTGFTLSWSKALSRKFINLFPDYEDFFATPSSEWDDRKKEEQPYFVIEKLEESEFAIKMVLPSDEALTLKQSLFDFIGPGKSLLNFRDSYDLTFLKYYFNEADNRWRADVFMVAANVQKYYKGRIADNKDQDRNAEKTIEDVGTAGLDAILSFLMDGPYIKFSEAGFLSMETIDDHFYFTMDRALGDDLNTDDKQLILELLDTKLDYYFGRLDGPGLRENLQTLVDQYASFFTKDFRYSFKDVLTDAIPGAIEGLSVMPPNQFKVIGYAGTDEWAEIPWIEIVDKRISRFANTGVAIKYLLNKDDRKLYLALCVGYKSIENDIIKNENPDTDEALHRAVADKLAPVVAEIRETVNPGSFDDDEKHIDLKDPRYIQGIAFFREYYGEVPADNVLETDLAEMLEIYNTYYARCVLKEDPSAVEEEPEDPEVETEADEQDTGESSDDAPENEEASEDVAETDKDNEPAEESEESNENETEPVDEKTESSDDVELKNDTSGEASKPSKTQPSEENKKTDAADDEDNVLISAISAIRSGKDHAKKSRKRAKAASGTPVMTGGSVQVVGTGLTKEDLIELQKVLLAAQKSAETQTEKNADDNKPEVNRHDDLFVEETLIDATSDVSGTLRQVSSYISAEGYNVDASDVMNLFLSIKSDPLVILTGVAGNGMMQFLRLFAEALGADEDNRRFMSVPVRTEWQNSDAVLGKVGKNDVFIPGILLETAARATENPDKPYFLCFEEMGLVPAENYFADVLSAIGSRRLRKGIWQTDILCGKERFGSDAEAYAYYGDLRLPENLHLFGTISADNIKGEMSSRLIDAATVIEIGYPSLQLKPAPNSLPKVNAVTSDFFKPLNKNLIQITDHRKMITEVVTLLDAMNGILSKAGAQIGVHVRDEIGYYLYFNAETGAMTQEKGLDYALSQKLLPRIKGRHDETEAVLIDLFKICAGTQNDEAIKSYDGNGGLFPRCALKLSQMARYFERYGEISFWKTIS